MSNFLEVLAILLIPAALCYTFGRMVGDTRQGWAILAAMTIVFVVLLARVRRRGTGRQPALAKLGVDQTASATQAGGNMEGKETRFGVVNSALWATATTAASNGSVNSMHDSFTPLGGLVPMWLMQLGEVIFGGVGSGLYGMLLFAVVAVFVAGLMIGRTPEYLGKKIEAFDIKMARIGVLVPLVHGAGRHRDRRDARTRARPASPIPARTASPRSCTRFPRPATTTAAPSPGCRRTRRSTTRRWASSCSSPASGSSCRCSRWPASLVAKKKVPAGAGTLPTHTPLFVFFLIGVVIVIGALTFFPALALGPIVEHLVLYGVK